MELHGSGPESMGEKKREERKKEKGKLFPFGYLQSRNGNLLGRFRVKKKSLLCVDIDLP